MRALLVVMALASVAAASPCAKPVVAAANGAWGSDGHRPTCRRLGAMVFVQAWFGDDPAEDVFYAAIVEPKTAHVAWSAENIPGTPGDALKYGFGDFDGDGVDEVLVHHFHVGHMATGPERLEILRVHGDEVDSVTTLTVALGQDHREGNSCASSGFAIVGGRTRRLQLTTEYTRFPGFPPAEGCPPEGLHRFRLGSDGFVLAD